MNILKIFIFCTLFTILSCTKTTEYMYCEDIECSFGRYVIKENSLDFQTYIKDSVDYRIEDGKDFQEESFLTIDSIMNIKNYLSDKEKKMLQRTTVKTEYVKGKWVEEYSINYILDFKNQKELNTFKIAYNKWKCAWMVPVTEEYVKKEPKYLGTLDTLKNGKLMNELIVENNRSVVIKNNKLFYHTTTLKTTENPNISDSLHIIFPKSIKNITNYTMKHKLSKDRKTLVLFDSLYTKGATKGKLLINFN